MRFWPIGLLLVGGAVAAMAPAPGKRCRVRVLNEDRNATRVDLFNNGSNINYDAAGNVQLRCIDQQVFLYSDSLSALGGTYLRLYGHVRYVDTSYRMTADTMIYVIQSELLQARGNVHVYDRTSGSTMIGPYLDYYRQVKGVNDSARIVALARPTVRYFGRTVPIDTLQQHPYILIGNTIRGFGQSKLYANGDATLDRDSLHAAGDSLDFTHAKNSTAHLFGDPAQLWRAGSDSLRVVGQRIRLELVDDHLQALFSYIKARVRRSQSDITGDTVTMTFVGDKLNLTRAWARTKLATVASGGYDLRSDSLAVDTPGEQLHEIRLFRDGSVQSPPDTSVKAPIDTVRLATPAADSARRDSIARARPRNTLTGNRVTVSFRQVDSSSATVTRLNSLLAIGNATSWFLRRTIKNGQPIPSINYTLADTISISMRPDADSVVVDLVNARGHVHGVQVDSNESALGHHRAGADSAHTPTASGRP